MFNGKSVLTGDYTHYYSKDPAFDVDHEDYDHERWVETQDDSHLPVKNGVKPVEFILRRLDAMDYAFCQDAGGNNQAAAWCVRLALRKLKQHGNDDEQIELVVEQKQQCMSRKWLGLIQGIDDGGLYAELVQRITREMNHDPK